MDEFAEAAAAAPALEEIDYHALASVIGYAALSAMACELVNYLLVFRRRLGSGEYGPGTDFLAEESVLTQLVQDGLGGNSHCLIIATLKTDSRHDWQQNIATMRYVDLARRIRTFPCRNDEAVYQRSHARFRRNRFQSAPRST